MSLYFERIVYAEAKAGQPAVPKTLAARHDSSGRGRANLSWDPSPTLFSDGLFDSGGWVLKLSALTRALDYRSRDRAKPKIMCSDMLLHDCQLIFLQGLKNRRPIII